MTSPAKPNGKVAVVFLVGVLVGTIAGIVALRVVQGRAYGALVTTEAPGP